MQKFDVGYFECTGCHCLQTEKPHWLDEATATRHTALDVGKAQRNVLAAMLCAYILEKIGVSRKEQCLDWGGVEGLFCRLMRDRGFNFFTYDKYVDPLYSVPYRVENPTVFSPVVLTAFEVFEHLPEPCEELGAIFSLHPSLLLCTTELYEQQGSDWMYLSVISGRHCFFYSKRGMEWIATRFGYRYIQLPLLHAFAANEVWELSELGTRRMSLDALAASKATLLEDAGQSLVTHLTGAAWRHIADDFRDIRKTRFGV